MRRLPALWVLLVVAPMACGDVGVDIDLTGRWQFIAGDDPSWSQTPPPGLEPIKTGIEWEKAGHPGHDGYGWYFRRVRLSPKTRQMDVLRLNLGQIDDSDETYFNGQKIGATGQMEPGEGSSWNVERVYDIPNDILRQDNLIAVRVADHKGKGGMHSGAPSIVGYRIEPIPTTGFAIDGQTSVFFPEGTGLEKLPPSLALVRDIREASAGEPLPDQWKLNPRFARHGRRHEVVIPVDLGRIDLYGGGEVGGPLLRDGTAIKLWNTDNFAYRKDSGSRLYQSHPWVMGVREDGSAFGVIFDSTWKAELDLESRIRFRADGPTFPVIIFERESPQAVMRALGEWTGTMELPPLWALGFQQCRYSYYPDSRVREVADEFRRRQIPCDVIWLDIDYMDGFRVFTFDPKHFPDPAATNGYLHKLGFKSVWMIDPGVKVDRDYAVYKTGTRLDVWVKNRRGETFTGDVWPGACVFPDFTIPRTRKWWASQYKGFMALGVDGVWNDMNEPAVFDGPGATMPMTNIHRGGDGLPRGPHLQYHNVYGMLMVRASLKGIKAANPDKRPFLLTRSNFLGGQRYAATWTGDNTPTWEHLRLSIPMSLTLGLSGQPFSGPDIGGFANHGEMDVELWKHWIALGAFYPFSRAHAVGQDNQDKEPWSFGPEAERVGRTALERRYRLLPYLYTLFHEASATGMPIMRPVFFADPSDLSLRDEEQAFLLGRDLLAIPRWAENPELPSGVWRTISVLDGDAEQDDYQLELRQKAGSIIPLGPIVQSTAGYKADPLTLLVCLDEAGEARGVLYQDAYKGYGYQDGQFLMARFHASRDGEGRVVIEVDDEAGALSVAKGDIIVKVVSEPDVKAEIR